MEDSLLLVIGAQTGEKVQVIEGILDPSGLFVRPRPD
jgi:hypothetical protein